MGLPNAKNQGQPQRFIRTVRLRNFLSYGDDGEEIELGPLNVLIGPNASGKSNLIEAMTLLRAAPSDLHAPIRQGGGVREWVWKGGQGTATAEIEVTVQQPPGGNTPLRYRLCFAEAGQKFELVDEVIESERPQKGVDFFYRFQNGQPTANVRMQTTASAEAASGPIRRPLRIRPRDPNQPVLAQLKEPERYPEVTHLGQQFGGIKLYREWDLGRRTEARRPQPADQPEDFLEEDARNLGMVLNDLEHHPEAAPRLLDNLKRLYDGVERVTTKIHGGTVQVYVHERGVGAIPATRLSDGTIRFLCLLTILCHPSPPPLICIEEPELGLHPDALAILAELLVEASERTQIIVTTHSDILVSQLTDVPESVIVCERDDAGTHLRRLERARLEEWLRKYSLGELWLMGEIGGTV
jgi:predicted ATPase